MDSKTKQQTVQMGTGKITVSEITMCGVFAALTFLLTYPRNRSALVEEQTCSGKRWSGSLR